MTILGRDLPDLSIRDASAGLRRGDWSARDLTTAVFDRIEATEPLVHAWVEIDVDQAVANADRAQDELDRGIDRGPLHGLPIGIKDIFDVAGYPTRCGSAARADVAPAERDADTVAVLRGGGALLLGKTVTQEFAAGVISPPARNPWNPDRIPGGSSGGSAVAVALGNCYGAMGSDTGGSIRIPAAACGVVGFKPAYGQLSVGGVFPLSWSLDTVGPLARSVDDVRLLWQVLVGIKAGVLKPVMNSSFDLKNLRFGVPGGFFLESVQPDIRESIEAAVDLLRSMGATIIELQFPLAAAARAAAFIINRVETAAVHERFAREEPERFRLYNPDLRLRIAAGSSLSASLYINAIRAREAIRDAVRDLYADFQIDAMVVPTLPTTAVSANNLLIEGTGLDEGIGASWTRLTMPFNATGQPVLALPCGFDRQHLPIGLQLVGAPGREDSLFRIGSALESALALYHSRPPLLSRIEHSCAADQTMLNGVEP